MLRFGAVSVDPPLILAPMAGITDSAFRRIIRDIGGVGLVSMEFISSESLTRGVESTLNKMAFDREERPLAIQIYGSNPMRMSEAARVVEDIGADVCDINMGCPANKILKGCAGAALMKDLSLAGGIIRAVRARIRIPLTVKFRLGMDEPRANWIELGKICEGEGVDGVTLHARTAKQMFMPRANWDGIARLKEALSIPVIGNGDVETAEDAIEMMRRTGCDGVMVGRAAMKNPWIFAAAAAALAGETRPAASPSDRRGLILRHFDLIRRLENERYALHKIRTFTGWYSHGLPNGRLLRARIGELGSPEEFIGAIEEFFDAPAVRDAAPALPGSR
jgi:nifR3 family TIM-barrel protein